jgi:hypothetical protein
MERSLWEFDRKYPVLRQIVRPGGCTTSFGIGRNARVNATLRPVARRCREIGQTYGRQHGGSRQRREGRAEHKKSVGGIFRGGFRGRTWLAVGLCGGGRRHLVCRQC